MTAELSIDEYRALLDEVFGDDVVAWTAEAEASERFPRRREGALARLVRVWREVRRWRWAGARRLR